MKKNVIGIGAVAAILIVYLAVQNNQLKSDVSQSKAKAQKLNDYIAETEKQMMSFEASDPAKSFIRSYFDFTDHPEEEDVEGLVTSEAKKLLDFGEVSQSAGEDEVEAEVKDLNVYYGDATNNRQELFATFTSVLTYNDETSEKASYIKLDMLKENDKWKVDHFEFRQ